MSLKQRVLILETLNMTNHFEFEEFDERSNIVEPSSTEREKGAEPASSCSASQRDRFELLSAYLDGEVTASERRQVESWLATDPKTQCLYSRLLTLRQGLQNLPIAKSEQSVEQFVDQVTARLDRQPRRWMWGGLAVAAMLVGAIFTAVPQDRYAPSIADSLDSSEEVPSSGLMIALNHPPIAIPNTASIPQSDSQPGLTPTLR
jgi:hypothetical protein